MSGFLFDALHGGLGRALDLRQAQHALTASNLANADTPGFRARYIPFDQVLSGIMNDGGDMQMAGSEPGNVSAGEFDSTPPVEEIEPTPWAIDGNSVVPEREAVRLKENALIYDALTRGLSRRMAMLKYAASDGRSNG